jgi:hypothetical protein
MKRIAQVLKQMYFVASEKSVRRRRRRRGLEDRKTIE